MVRGELLDLEREKREMTKIVSCMACGARYETVQESLGHPCFTEGYAGMYKVNDLDAWARTALDNGLRVITLFDADRKPVELVIINDSDQPERDERALWIKPYRLIGWVDRKATDLDPGEALAMIAKLRKPIK